MLVFFSSLCRVLEVSEVSMCVCPSTHVHNVSERLRSSACHKAFASSCYFSHASLRSGHHHRFHLGCQDVSSCSQGWPPLLDCLQFRGGEICPRRRRLECGIVRHGLAALEIQVQQCLLQRALKPRPQQKKYSRNFIMPLEWSPPRCRVRR